METNIASKKKTSSKPKKTTSARQQKKESFQRNVNAAVSAIAKYSTKTSR